ncbi:S-layer homology domain-containing protein [Paenibacillus glycanilyticus]|uniref:S-layer homology domain-containing protein n=1 Tax=Paenibacillus glycanilyticus TaxID=126569 RepID=UPI0020414BB0|nr:S-layer homology domain-containing protein [Paenibacillus glycanilyticus]MCM3630333.1 S-layer homology domain-containing protein [Paenibacillus glycanilyticus]
MTIRKKLIVSTIAASVAATAFAGLPLSNKGLAEKLGFNNTAYATSAFPSTDIVDYAKKLRAALVATDGLDEVQALRTDIKALSTDDLKSIASPITSRVTTKLGASFDPDDKKAVEALVLDVISVTYDPNLTELERIRNTDAYRAVLAELAVGAGFDPQEVDDLTVDDVADYFFTLQEKVAGLIKGLSTEQLFAALSDPVKRAALIEDAFEALAAENLIVQDIFDAYDIETSDLKEVVVSAQAKVDSTTVLKAAMALYGAYLKMNESTGGPGPIGGGGEEEVKVEVPKEVTDFIDDIKKKLANATEAEKLAILTQAVQQATALVTKLSSFDLSSNVTVTNGQAALQVSGSSVLSAIAGIGEILKNVKELAPGVAIPTVLLNINLGNVAQNDVKIGLNDAVIQEAIKAGLGGINLSVNGLNAVLPVGGQFNGAVDFNINKAKADSTTTGGQQAASEVYSFGLSIGGKAVTTFAQPILISIPLGNVDGVDKELLSLAKIVDGKPVFQGGSVQGDKFVEHRDTFSSYVVVENKVTFTDIKSVEAWAGRAIQVIAAKGAIEGKKAGVFAPKDNVTRAEFAKMLTRALDLDNSLATENFADVKDTDWSAPYIGAAAKLGIIQGRSATKFDPNAQITRAEMATMIARALKVTKGAKDVTDVNAALAGFKDASSISTALKPGVAFSSKNGIVIGNNGKFSPNASATRAEAAVMIYRAVNFK